MKIVLATGIYPPEIGGPATYAKLLNDRLTASGFEIVVLPFREVRIWPKIIRHLVYVVKILRQVRGARIIFTQDPVSTGLPSLIAAKLSGKKLVIRVAGDYTWEQVVQRLGVKENIDEFQNQKYGWVVEALRSVQKFVVRRADLIITPSDYFRELVSKWGVASDKIVRIYNGIELPPVGSDLSERKKVFVTAGRLVPWKGFEAVIEVMTGFPDYKLLIIGDGPDRERLAKLIETFKLGNQVTLTGQIPREQMWETLSQASLFILNTSFESFSFQVVEAMAAGVPVITTNVGSLPELIRDGRTGYLIKPNDSEALKQKISQVLANSEVTAELVARARQDSESFSIEQTLQQLAKVFQQVARSS